MESVMSEKLTTVRVRVEPTLRRWRAEKLMRTECKSLDEALVEIFRELDKNRKRRNTIEDIFHL